MFTLESLLLQILSASNSWLQHVLSKKQILLLELILCAVSWLACTLRSYNTSAPQTALWHCILQNMLFYGLQKSTEKNLGNLRWVRMAFHVLFALLLKIPSTQQLSLLCVINGSCSYLMSAYSQTIQFTWVWCNFRGCYHHNRFFKERKQMVHGKHLTIVGGDGILGNQAAARRVGSGKSLPQTSSTGLLWYFSGLEA